MSDLQTHLPAFASEADEAEWWFDHREELGGEFAQAIEKGHAGRGTVVRRAEAAATPITLGLTDATNALELAERRGLEYRAYVVQLIHEALEREMKLAG